MLFPALGLGYLVVPPDLIEGFLAAKALSDRNSHTLEQAVLASFIWEGHFGRHIRRMRVLYEQRQRVLPRAVAEELGDKLILQPAAAGMHLVGWLPEDVTDEDISQRAEEFGLTVPALSSYSLRNSRPGLILGYAAFDEEGIRRLANAL